MKLVELMALPPVAILADDVAKPFVYYGHPKGNDEPSGLLASLGVIELEFNDEAGTYALRAVVTEHSLPLHERLRAVMWDDGEGNKTLGIGLLAFTARKVVRHIFLTACTVHAAKCLVRSASLIEEVSGTFETVRPLPPPVLEERLVSPGK